MINAGKDVFSFTLYAVRVHTSCCFYASNQLSAIASAIDRNHCFDQAVLARCDQLLNASHRVALMCSTISVVFTCIVLTDSNDTVIPSENFDEDIFETLPGREGKERSQLKITFRLLSFLEYQGRPVREKHDA